MTCPVVIGSQSHAPPKAKISCVAAFIFFNFLLSIAATVFATKAIEEIKVKQREEYNRLSVLSDTLQYEVDQ